MSPVLPGTPYGMSSKTKWSFVCLSDLNSSEKISDIPLCFISSRAAFGVCGSTEMRAGAYVFRFAPPSGC